MNSGTRSGSSWLSADNTRWRGVTGCLLFLIGIHVLRSKTRFSRGLSALRGKNHLKRLAPLRDRAPDGLPIRDGLDEFTVFRAKHVIAIGRQFFGIPGRSCRLVDRHRATVPPGKFHRDDTFGADQFHLPAPRHLEKVQMHAGHAMALKIHQNL